MMIFSSVFPQFSMQILRKISGHASPLTTGCSEPRPKLSKLETAPRFYVMNTTWHLYNGLQCSTFDYMDLSGFNFPFRNRMMNLRTSFGTSPWLVTVKSYFCRLTQFYRNIASRRCWYPATRFGEGVRVWNTC